MRERGGESVCVCVCALACVCVCVILWVHNNIFVHVMHVFVKAGGGRGGRLRSRTSKRVREERKVTVPFVLPK